MTITSEPIRLEINFSLEDMHQFQRLIQSLRMENRFHLSLDTEQFVSGLIKYAHQAKTINLESNRLFWRARLHDVMTNKPWGLNQLGSPPPHLAGHGRLNPRGIPYLYLASDELTAVSEVRPWKDAELTLAQFKTMRALCLVNLSTQPQFAQPCPAGMEGADFTWRELITWLFSVPFDPRDDTAYVPTQYIAERIKASSFDGLIYDSALHDEGYNVALFDPDVAVAITRKVAKINSVMVNSTFTDLTGV